MVFLELRGDFRVTTRNSGFLLSCPRKSNLLFDLGGRAGGCSRVTAGQIDLIETCVQDVMILFRGDRNIGVAFQSHPVGQALSRGKAKDTGVLSSGLKDLLGPLSGLK